MKWPRGRYNGQRIGGFTLKVEFNLCWRTWAIYWTAYGKSFHIGPLHIWMEPSYEK